MSGSSWDRTWERPRLQTSSLQLVLGVVVLVVDVLGVVDGVVVVVVIGVDVRIEDVDHTAARETSSTRRSHRRGSPRPQG